MKIKLTLLAMIFMNGACASKVLILEAPVVSMTVSNSGELKALREGKAIEEKWCNSEEPVHPNDDGSKHYGLIDQVIWRAHANTKSNLFVNNRFYQLGDCVFMSANVTEGGGAAAGASSKASVPGKKEGPSKKKLKSPTKRH